jgi:hypothetical protein
MDAKNRQIAIAIEQLRKPIAQISERDLAEARQLNQRLRDAIAGARAQRSGL